MLWKVELPAKASNMGSMRRVSVKSFVVHSLTVNAMIVLDECLYDTKLLLSPFLSHKLTRCLNQSLDSHF